MNQTSISPEITQLTRFGLVNCFLVREHDGFTLVDTGLSGSAKHILVIAAQLNGPIRRILLTHSHGDHAGSLDAMAETLGGAEVAIGRREALLLARDFHLEPGEPKVKLRGSFPATETRPTVLLEDGDLYGSLQVIATPGHTPGHLCFLDIRSGTLLAGDALTTIGELRVVSDPPWNFPLAAMGTWHKPTAVASARKLAALRPERIAAGHGKPVLSGGAQELQRAINRCS